MKVLFIGGTGNISTSVSKLAIEQGVDLYLLNRGKKGPAIPGAKSLFGDISRPDEMAALLKDHSWDVVVDWIAYLESDVQRDFELFNKRTKQYIFISSASAYQRPATSPFITESTPLANPYWQYSRNKIACEDRLTAYYRQEGFPMTIVRPSLTYDTVMPVPIGGWTEYTTVDRIKKGQKIIVHGDGSSLWTITHAEDFAKGFVGLLGHQQAVGQAFHITSDEVLTWDQIHQAIGEALGREVHIVHISSDFLAAYDKELLGGLIGDKATSVIFDNSKIKRFVPGYVATIPFKQGIKRTVEWFEADASRRVIKASSNEWIERVIGAYEKGLPQ